MVGSQVEVPVDVSMSCHYALFTMMMSVMLYAAHSPAACPQSMCLKQRPASKHSGARSLPAAHSERHIERRPSTAAVCLCQRLTRLSNHHNPDRSQVLARQEAGTRPVPRTVLVCCAALTAVGPQTKGIFSEAAGADLVSRRLWT